METFPGLNQTHGTMLVFIGNTACEITESSYTEISCLLEPSAVTGLFDVVIMSGSEVHMKLSDAYTFIAGEATGTIDSVSPTVGNRMGG